MAGLGRRWILVLTVLAVAVAGTIAAVTLRSSEGQPRAAGGDCAPGFQPVARALAEVRAEMRAERGVEGGTEGGEEGGDAAEEAAREGEDQREGHESEEARELQREAVAELPMLAGTDPDDWDSLCVRSKRPESLQELSALFGARAIPRLAPYGAYAAGAATNAVAQRDAMRAGSVPGTAGKARPWGRGPLVVDDPAYPEVNGLGLADNSGRIDSYAWVPKAHRLFAAVGNGGIWRSDDLAKTWTSANGNLPTTVTGAVAWSGARGGTLLALTGEPTFGSSAYTGLGGYLSSDLGKHWKRSTRRPGRGPRLRPRRRQGTPTPRVRRHPAGAVRLHRRRPDLPQPDPADRQLRGCHRHRTAPRSARCATW